MARPDRKSRRSKNRTASEDAIGPDNGPAPDAPEMSEPSTATSSDPDRSDAAAPEITVRDLPADSSRAETAEWPFRQWPDSVGPRPPGFQVLIRRSVLNEINRHGQTTRDIEVCGVLAGNVFRDDAGSYLLIEAAVRGDHAGSSAAQVTFTAETWKHMQGVMEKDHADLRVVGWYHTHPGFGIFLSDMDLFIHGNFFNLPWQIALVYDPVSGEEGIFIWRDSKTVRVPFIVEEDVEKEMVTIPISPEISAAALAEFSRRMQQTEKRQKTLIVALAFMSLMALGWPFVLFTILSDNRRSSRVTPPAAGENISTAANQLQVVSPSTVPATLPAPGVPIGPTTDPVTSALIHPLPSTMQANLPSDPLLPPTTQPNNEVQKPELIPSVIRPTTPMNKGPHILENPADTSKP